MPESLQDLFVALERSVTLLELVRIAVRICAAEGVDQKPIAVSDLDGRAWLELRADLGRAFRAGEHPAHLSREERAALASIVRRAEGTLPAGVFAYLLLEAVDALDGNGLSRAFEAERSAEALPGQVIPVAPATHLTAVFGPGRQLSSQAHSVGRGLSSFRHFSVLPPLALPYRVAFRFVGEAEMDDLLERRRVAVLLPNCRPWEKEFDLQRQEARACFGHVRPKDPGAQRAAIELALARADQMGATIAILPELSVDSSAHPWLSEWMRMRSRRLKLLVAGSFHPAPGDSGRFNRCIVYGARGAVLLSHDKFNRYVLGTLHEDLEAREFQLNVAWARGRPFSVLICKDVLDADVDHVLQAIRLHWLCVPAWSAKSDAFARRLGILQTITVIANYPGGPGTEADAAIASLPLVGNQLVGGRLPDSPPGVLFLQLDDFPLEWQEVR